MPMLGGVDVLRKAIAEPVFGQVKEACGFRPFSVPTEPALICLTPNAVTLLRDATHAIGSVTVPVSVGPGVSKHLVISSGGRNYRVMFDQGCSALAVRRAREVERGHMKSWIRLGFVPRAGVSRRRTSAGLADLGEESIVQGAEGARLNPPRAMPWARLTRARSRWMPD